MGSSLAVGFSPMVRFCCAVAACFGFVALCGCVGPGWTTEVRCGTVARSHPEDPLHLEVGDPVRLEISFPPVVFESRAVDLSLRSGNEFRIRF
jgi:hypothetical protein